MQLLIQYATMICLRNITKYILYAINLDVFYAN